MPEYHAFIGLGSNQGDRAAQLRGALGALQDAGLEALALSSVWETEPVGTSAPAWFVNLVSQTANTIMPERPVLGNTSFSSVVA